MAKNGKHNPLDDFTNLLMEEEKGEGKLYLRDGTILSTYKKILSDHEVTEHQENRAMGILPEDILIKHVNESILPGENSHCCHIEELSE